jgi:catechol 2,3-dioxygenase-like lactoylglutathione lyase family enzyme
MEVNGIAHAMLIASNFETSRAFYQKLLPFLRAILGNILGSSAPDSLPDFFSQARTGKESENEPTSQV